MTRVSEHDRIAGLLESIHAALWNELHEQEAAATYHQQHASELDAIARRMGYSADQQRIFRISRESRRLAREDAMAMARRRELGKSITRGIKRVLANRNAANGSTSAA